jgi:hypothetical protein
MAVFWVVAPCSLVEVYRRFRGPCCLHHQGEDSHLRTHRRENLKTYSETRVIRIPELLSSHPTRNDFEVCLLQYYYMKTEVSQIRYVGLYGLS